MSMPKAKTKNGSSVGGQTKPRVRARKPKASKVEREHWMARNYPAKYMMIAIAIIMAVNLVSFNPFTQAELNSGFALLDMTELTVEVAMGVKEAFQPTIDFVYAVNDFYEQSADALTYLLSGQDTSIFAFVYAVNDFYTMATNEMIALLDLSDHVETYQSQVAGIMIEVE
jgi:hypothetical protein